MKQEDDDHETDHDRLFQEVPLQRFDGCLNQAGPIIAGHNFHAWRQRKLDLRQLLFDPVDHGQRVHAVTHDDDAAYRFSLAVPLRHTFADVRAEPHRAQVPDQHRSTVLGGYGDIFQVAQRS